MFNVMQLIAFSLLFIIIGIFINNKYFRFFLLTIGSSFIVLEIVSLLTIGEFLNYQIYSNMNIDIFLEHISQFYIYVLFLILLLVSLPFIFQFLIKKTTNTSLTKKYLLLFSISIIYLCYPSGILWNFYKLYQQLNLSTNDISFRSSLSNIGINPKDYIYKEDVIASGEKNIIVISLESLEQAFLSKKEFSHLTPNLRKLSKELTFYKNIKQSMGGGWTSASMYSYLVGVPALFSQQGNNVFQQSQGSDLVGLGNVLKKANYSMEYILSKSNVSGMNDLMKSYYIKPIDDKNSIGNYKKHKMGLDMHDYDVFKEAKLQLQKFKKSGNKFALFLSTLDTHFPTGFPDKRMENFIDRKNYNTDIEFCIASIDYLIGDFFKFLAKENLLGNTAVYIFPDHRTMGRTGDMYNRLKKYDRKLYLLTNVQEDNFTLKTPNKIYQIDLPRIIVEGSSIKTNAKFLVDFINNRNIDTFIQENYSDLVKLNMTALKNCRFTDEIQFQLNKNKLIVNSHENFRTIPIEKKNLTSSVIDVVFDSSMRIKSINKLKKGTAFILSGNDQRYTTLHLLITIENNQIVKTHFGDKQLNNIVKHYPNNKIFKSEIIKILAINDKNRKKVIRKNKIKVASKYAMDSKRYIAHAGGSIDNYVYTNSLESLNLSYKKGFKLFELDISKTSDNYFVAAHDWKLWKKMTKYEGDLPPSRNEFLNYKIFNKYTPMDINVINKWFKSHKDAVLVTDKIKKLKDVENFIAQFVDKKRLMMELFAWGHVEKAIKLGIYSAMPTGGLLKPHNTEHIKEGIIEYLHKIGVKDIASSAKMLKYKSLLKDIKRAGINVYAFQINSLRERKLIKEKKLTKEQYVICKLRNCFYGVYANKWNFEEELPCALR